MNIISKLKLWWKELTKPDHVFEQQVIKWVDNHIIGMVTSAAIEYAIYEMNRKENP